MAAEKAVAMGWLAKKDGWPKSWKQHWVVLYPNRIEYFKKKEDKQPIRQLMLKNCTGTTSKNTFTVSGPGLKKAYDFQAESEADAQMWHKAVEKQISKATAASAAEMAAAVGGDDGPPAAAAAAASASSDKPDKPPPEGTPTCAHCSEPIVANKKFGGEFLEFEDGRSVHAECKDEFIKAGGGTAAAAATECAECGEKLDGQVHVLNAQSKDPVSVHERCKDAYTQKHDEKCAHCNTPLVADEGSKFSGAVATVEGKLVHMECKSGFGKGTLCTHCKDPIGDPTEMVTTGDGAQIHAKCRTAYETTTAPDCIWCKEKIVEVAGKFTGVMHDMPEGKVHDECRTAYELDKRGKKEGRDGLEGQIEHAAKESEGDEIYELAGVVKEDK